MGKIAILPPAVQGQIAAGEVIERPASVVRELAENALDAGARNIEVQLAAGGVELIAVRDDGEGMAPEDAVLAFGRHATSKLAAAEELSAVQTLGFRGEALPSIASVASVRLVTRRSSDAAACVVETESGEACAAGIIGAAPGTLCEVRALFAATAARRKFLRTASTEVGHVVDVLTRLAVASPQVGFRLEQDGREVLAWPGVGALRARLAQVLGRARAAGLVELEAERGGCVLRGFLGTPRETLASARMVWTYVAIGAPTSRAVAGRWVRDRVLLRAVLDGYASLLMKGRYPVAVLFAYLPSGEVDVNVHPAKLEVRFRQPAALHQLMVPAIRQRLTAALQPPAEAVVSEGAGTYAVSDGGPSGTVVGWGDAPPPRESQVPRLPLAASQPGLWTLSPTSGFRSLRFIGQVFAGYLLCEGDGRLVLVDQHAAHERVVFERLRAADAARGVERDALLVPETIGLPPAQVATLAEHAALLAAAGLEGEAFGPDTFLLRTVPRLLRGHDVGDLMRTLAGDLVDGQGASAVASAREAVLATIACHSVVRVGQRLEADEVHALLALMDDVPINAHCPHGRPVAVELRRNQVEALFGR